MILSPEHKTPPDFSGGVSVYCFVRVAGRLLAHVHLLGDLGREVLFLLLNALALDEVDGIDKLHAAAELLGGVGDVALDGAVEQVGADEDLLEQAM